VAAVGATFEPPKRPVTVRCGAPTRHGGEYPTECHPADRERDERDVGPDEESPDREPGGRREPESDEEQGEHGDGDQHAGRERSIGAETPEGDAEQASTLEDESEPEQEGSRRHQPRGVRTGRGDSSEPCTDEDGRDVRSGAERRQSTHGIEIQSAAPTAAATPLHGIHAPSRYTAVTPVPRHRPPDGKPWMLRVTFERSTAVRRPTVVDTSCHSYFIF
jgi:hypothetical protein